jgi:hypothetical protein
MAKWWWRWEFLLEMVVQVRSGNCSRSGSEDVQVDADVVLLWCWLHDALWCLLEEEA